MQLSDHFVLGELIRSDSAARRGIDNRPDDDGVDKLRALCANILEPVRARFGRPVTVNSGYRCPALNRAIGGSSRSQHMLCEAVDFEVSGVANWEVAAWVRDNLAFDQLILEAYTAGRPDSGWVHASWKPAGGRGRDGRDGVLTMEYRVRNGRRTSVYRPGLIL